VTEGNLIGYCGWFVAVSLGQAEALTVISLPADGIPLATTKSLLAPVSVLAATLKFVDPCACGATVIVL
jgi:hypothetical protein